ncbi:MAG: homocysteine S-methyltransferase family protein [Clostridiales bacterium]|nr:homocysteine S-methyltransferase family protein [Clostridiales bacterium]
MKVTEYIKSNITFLDGGMGTLLQEQGLFPGELPETWNLSHPKIITEIHRSYFDAGCNIVNTNTFGANSLKFSSGELDGIIKAAIKNARTAISESSGPQRKWVALDIGPTGRMLQPYGDLAFEDAVSVFAETVRLGVKYGADLIFIETMNDSYETKAALLAAKENSDLPVFVSNAFGDDGKLMTGANPAALAAMLEGMGADAIGVNCSLGPKALAGVVTEYLKYSSVPVILKPNAGLPRVAGGKTVYDVPPRAFAEETAALVRRGVRAVGGCCGTTPEYIREIVRACSEIAPLPIEDKKITSVSSYTHAVVFGNGPVLIGERINPTGKKRLKEALREHDIDYILKEGISQQDKGVHILDVNVGLPEIDEVETLKTAVCELQAVVDLPLQIDTSDTAAMEAALRLYNGKAMINSVSGKKESMDAVFPLAKKYGGLIVALTLDESGIPSSAGERLAIARKILSEAERYGISKKDIIFDPLAMAVSADLTAAKETLRAVSLIKNELGCHTSLGVSNVSFGLPGRDMVNGTFFALALGCGLSAAIMNPNSAEMMKTYFSFRALEGLDGNFSDYIGFAGSAAAAADPPSDASPAAKTGSGESGHSELQNAVIKGLKEQASRLTEELVSSVPPLQIVQDEIIPALDFVGVGFENKTLYLPQLLMSAEAAKAAFEVIKSKMPGDKAADRCRFVIATVKGDIHDIGKNIVKLILENYGFPVTDLGRDVSPETVARETVRLHAPLVGLSALMTTTVPAMEETIRLLRREAPWCRIVVGGAVLTREYADAIGADKYAKDAMETVRYAEEVDRSIHGIS